MLVSSFINSLGVTTHFNPNIAGPGYFASQKEQAFSALEYIGITTIRDGLLSPGNNATLAPIYDYLATNGIRFDLVATPVSYTGLTTNLTTTAAFAHTHPGSIIAIEGPNEPNSGYSYVDASGTTLTGQAAALAAVADMVGTVGGNDDLSNVETFGQSGYQIEDAAAFENTHYYQKAGGNQPYTGMANTVANHAAISSDPLVITETGYATVITTPTDYNPLDPWEGVDEATQAKLTLNSLFDATLLGVHSVYLYQLFDGAAPTSQNANKPAAHLGLFGYLPVGDTDWLATAKQSAIALHNLTTVLNGTSDPFSGPALTYSVSGLPAGGASLALDKTSGVKDIVLWAEPDIWDQVNDQAITVTPTDATVSFNGSTVNVRIYDPMLGEAAILTYSNVTSVTVAATDHPVIVEVVSGQIVNGTDTGNKLFGGTGADLLNGLGGADTLDGGAGSDRMVGGLGGDIYIVDNADDQVVENVAEGTDTVKASLSYALVDNVEKLTLTGTGAINGTGNAVANTIIGNDGDNVLNGRGNNDVLTGGLGADTFVFDVLETSANKDTIKDFVSGTDHIAISVAAFGGLAAYGLGTLDASELAYGTGATTADQHLVYNTGTGGLYYDADGVGGTAQVQLALLSLQPVLLASDIVLI